MSISVYQQMRLFDGNPVDQFAARFSTYDLDDEEANAFRDGELLVMVMVASVEGATIKPTPAGDRKRVNSLKVHNMRVATGEMRENLVEVFHLADSEDQLPLGMPLPTTLIPSRVDPSTGELLEGSGVVAHVLSSTDSEDGGDETVEELELEDVAAHVFNDIAAPDTAPRADYESGYVGAASHDKALASFLGEGT